MSYLAAVRRHAFVVARAVSLGLAVMAPVFALIWAWKAAARLAVPGVVQRSLYTLGGGRADLPPVEQVSPKTGVIYLLAAIPVLLACAPLALRRHELRPEAEIVPAILTAGMTIAGAWSIGLPFAGAAVLLVPLAAVGWIERRLGRGIE